MNLAADPECEHQEIHPLLFSLEEKRKTFARFQSENWNYEQIITW